MKYSVIIPVYNAEKTLKRCVQSILNQSFGDYEILLVNDGSADKSLDVCKKLADENDMIVVINKENGGASSARNAGLDAARGEYILFVDSDDYVCDNFFDKMNEYDLESGLLVFTNFWLRGSGDRLIQRNINGDINSSSLYDKTEYLLASRTINGPYPKKFSKRLIDDYSLRFNEDMPVAEDFYFCFSYLLHCNDVLIFNEAVYVNDQRNDDSLSRGRKYGLIDVYPIVFDAVFDLIKNCHFSEKEKYKLCTITDKLHTDSFATCVMEELKGKNRKPSEIKKQIGFFCEKFYSRYPERYGYYGIVHRVMRFCIKHKCKNAFYYFGKIYMKIRD